MADDATVGIRAEADAASFTSAGRQGANAYDKGFSPIKGMIQRSIDAASGSFGIFGKDMKNLSADAGQLRDAMAGVGNAAKKAGAAFADVRTESLERDLIALKDRSEAFKDALTSTGAPPKLFAVYEAELDKLLRLQTEFNRDYERLVSDDAALAGWNDRFKAVRVALERETQAVKSGTKSIRDQLRDSAAGERAIVQAGAREKTAIVRAESVKENAVLQQATTIRNAEIRTQAQVAIESSQRTARTRIELLRFTFRQIQVIERSIGAIFKGTAAVAAGAFARVEKTVFRLAGVFRRGNSDYTAGLSPALNRREGIIRRSFHRQESDVRSSVARQSVTIQRFEAQASTGIAGALTGRSSLGALFGGGLALGGGFALFRKLSDSLQVGGDFVQGLAVLQAQLQLTAEEMVGVRQLSIDLGNDITLPGVSALDAAQAIAALTKQFGALGEQALPAAQSAAKGVLQLSRATGASAEDAAALVGSATNVFGIGADSAVATADKITAALTRAAGVGVTEFKDSFTQAANVFALFQKPVLGAEGAIVELNTALAVLAKGGLTGSQAGTGLKQFFIQAVKADDSAVALRKSITEAAGESGDIFFDASGSARAFTDSIDILRRGLSDVTDAERTRSLIKLFGARATTVANILINEEAQSFDDLREAQLREGAAADIAAAQNVGLRGALDALGSVIETQQIKTYERWQGVAAKVVLKLADLFQAFFDGVGIMAKVRTAITGVTIALGALLLLKGSFEVFKFLSIGLSGLISPLGLVVAGTAALGGVIALLLKSSPDFRTAIGDIGNSLNDVVVPIIGIAGDLFAKFATLLNEKVLPAIVDFSVALAGDLRQQVQRFTQFLQDKAVPALIKFKDAFVEIAGPIIRDVFDFIKSIVNPVISRLGQLIEVVVIPAFTRFAGVLGDKVDPALQKVRDFASTLRSEIGPLIQPATDAFRQLGDAIGAIAGQAASGGVKGSNAPIVDFSGLIPAFQAVIVGIAKSFANIAERIIEVLGPQLLRVVGFITGFFTEDRLIGIVSAFGRIAKAIGKALGTIVSSPEFLGVIAAVVAAAGYLAISFLEGFGRGLAVGLPRTFEALKGEIGPLFGKLLKGVFDPKLIAKAIIGGFLIVGLASSLVKTMQRPVDTAGKKIGDGFVKSFAKQIKYGVGAGTSRNPFASGFRAGDLQTLERQAAQGAEAQLRGIEKANGRAAARLKNLGVAPRLSQDANLPPGFFRSTTKQLDDLTAHVGGASKLLGVELRSAIRNIRGGFGEISRGIGTTFKSTTQEMTNYGGRVIQGGLKQIGDGFKAGFIAIRANLKGTAVGVGQALGGALLGGLGAVMSGQQLAEGNKLLGISGIVASGLLTLQATQSPAAAAAVVGLGLVAGAWTKVKNETKAAKEEAQRLIDVYKGALGGSTGLEGQVRDLGTAFITEIGRLPAGSQNLLSNINVDDFARGVLDGSYDIQQGFASILRDAGFTEKAISNVFDEDLIRIDADTALERWLGRLRVADNKDVIRKRLGIDGEVDLGQLDIAATLFVNTINGIPEVKTAVANSLKLQASQAGTFFDFPIPADVLANASGPGSFGPQLDEVDEKLLNAQYGAEDLRQAIDDLNLARTEGIQSKITDLTTELDVAKSIAEDARGALDNLLGGNYRDSVQSAIDQAVTSIPSIGSSLADAFKVGGESGGSYVRQALEQFNLGEIIKKQLLIDPGTDLAAFVEPIRVAIREAKLPKNVKARLQQEVTDQIGTDGLAATAQMILDAEAEVSRLQEEIDKYTVDLHANVIIDSNQIRLALAEAGFDVRNFNPVEARNAQFDPAQIAEGQRLAKLNAGPEASPTTPAAPQGSINEYVFNVEQTIIGTTNPLATAAETVRSLAAAASGSLLRLTPGTGGSAIAGGRFNPNAGSSVN